MPMLKMMVYKEANQKLGSSLSPNNRCICKKTAIDNHAVASNLTAYVNNRLVPATAVILITYTATFKDWDGTVLKTQTVNYGGSATPPANPSRTGYTFTGWSPSSMAMSGDTVFTAQYQINSYTIRFLDYNGSVLKTQTLNYGQTPTPPSNPSRTGHTFTGWYPSIATVTENKDYTAQYSVNSYTVSFVSDGTTVKTETVDYGDYATPPSTNPTKIGLSFTGWSPNPSTTPITSNTTFTAQFIVNEYTVTWKNWDGSTYAVTLNISYGSYVTPPTTNPTRSGNYVFAGWDPNPSTTPITSNRDFTAQYRQLNTYTITYNYNGGTDGSGRTSYVDSYTEGETVRSWDSLGITISNGNNTFGGWDWSDGIAPSGTISRNYSAIATWGVPVVTTYSVRFYDSITGDQIGSSIMKGSNSTVSQQDVNEHSHPDHTSMGKEPDGWRLGSTSGSVVNPVGYTITNSDVNFYAMYKDSTPSGNTITITFVDNLSHNNSVSISRTTSNNSYTLQASDFPSWSDSITHNGIAYTKHNPFWNYSAGNTITSSTTIAGTYDEVVNNSKYYNFYEASQFGGALLYHGNVENGKDPITTLGADAWANNHGHEGYDFTGWSGPTETQHVGSVSYDYVATYQRNETVKTISFELIYRDQNTPAQAITGSVNAHAGGWGSSGNLTPGNGCTLSCNSPEDWGYDVYGVVEINGTQESFSGASWNSTLTYYVEDYVELGGNSGGGGDDPNEHNNDTPTEPGGNDNPGTNDDNGEGGQNEENNTGNNGSGGNGNTTGENPGGGNAEDPNQNNPEPGSGDGGGGNNETPGGNDEPGPDTNDDEDPELLP